MPLMSCLVQRDKPNNVSDKRNNYLPREEKLEISHIFILYVSFETTFHLHTKGNFFEILKNGCPHFSL